MHSPTHIQESAPRDFYRFHTHHSPSSPGTIVGAFLALALCATAAPAADPKAIAEALSAAASYNDFSDKGRTIDAFERTLAVTFNKSDLDASGAIDVRDAILREQITG